MRTHPEAIFVGGSWIPSEGERIEVIDPANEQVVGLAACGTAAEVAAAAGAARAAFDVGDWSQATLDERIGVLSNVLKAIEDGVDELAELQTRQMGVPIAVSRAMIQSNVALFRSYVDGAQSIEYEYVRRDGVGQSLVRRVPVGVVGAVTPWNGPLATVLNKAVPALLAGCAVVVKPAAETPFDAGVLADLLSAAGLPAGLFNVVTGGSATGAALVESPTVDKVTFTGSSAAGKQVGEVCGRNLKRVSLELGGKSAGIMLEDVDLGKAVPQVVTGNFFNSGQSCIAITRVLVPASRHDEMVEALQSATLELVVGDPMDESTQLGPLVARRQLERVERYVEIGCREGAKVVVGGGKPPGIDRGFFFEPTIFVGVSNRMTIAREEIFGPVMSVIPYDNETEAIAIANDSDYGLHGAVFTAEVEHGLDVASRIQSGSVSVNSSGLTPGTPYGGLKGSGLGREHGREGIEGFLEYRSYVVPAELGQLLERRVGVV